MKARRIVARAVGLGILGRRSDGGQWRITKVIVMYLNHNTGREREREDMEDLAKEIIPVVRYVDRRRRRELHKALKVYIQGNVWMAGNVARSAGLLGMRYVYRGHTVRSGRRAWNGKLWGVAEPSPRGLEDRSKCRKGLEEREEKATRTPREAPELEAPNKPNKIENSTRKWWMGVAFVVSAAVGLRIGVKYGT